LSFQGSSDIIERARKLSGATAGRSQAMGASIARFMAGERDADMTGIVDADLSYAQRTVEEMRRRGVYAGLI